VNVIGIGSEVVECLRVAQMIERHGELFINRVYTAAEIKFCNSRKHATRHFAGRWAAKEAVVRALGVRSRKGFDWRDVEIRRDKNGRLTAAFRGAARDLIEQWNVGDIHLTIAHCRSVATATALVLARASKRTEDE
jgi:holo-[acyl-carrier protein] synthase